MISDLMERGRDLASYHLNVSLVGRAALRLDRIRSELRLKRSKLLGPADPHLAPPLDVSPRLKELISRHYLRGRHANSAGKVAWVTSAAPVELLVALGYYVLYPENHGAVCGIRRTARELCEVAEAAGYSPDLCSYARTDIGALLSGKTPVGRLPKPDLLLCCTNICQTVLFWYRVLAHHFRVPLIVIDTPFIYGEARAHDIAFVERQLDAAVETAERVAGRSLSPRRLRETVRLAADATHFWRRIVERGAHRPAPLTAFDQFIHMAPIVEMRGEPYTVSYYRAMDAELQRRVEAGTGAVRGERRRLLWDNLPIWHHLRRLANLLARQGIALVASTYTNAWAELSDMIDPERPLESAARTYLHPILNRGSGHKLETMRSMVRTFGADGVILHSDRSCKPYSIGQIDQRERLSSQLGVPALLLEADHNDPRSFSPEQVANRLAAFIEILGVEASDVEL